MSLALKRPPAISLQSFRLLCITKLEMLKLCHIAKRYGQFALGMLIIYCGLLFLAHFLLHERWPHQARKSWESYAYGPVPKSLARTSFVVGRGGVLHHHRHQRRRENLDHWDFSGAKSVFGALDFRQMDALSFEEFKQQLLSAIPLHIRHRAEAVLPLALSISHKYQMDPFWVLSVMWVESQFNPRAISPADARGLMQILPENGDYILRLMGRGYGRGISLLLIYEPGMNTEMGVVYLRYLLQRFGGRANLATAAYNMGPYGVKRWVAIGRPISEVGYLKRVRQAYFNLLRPFHTRLQLKQSLLAQNF